MAPIRPTKSKVVIKHTASSCARQKPFKAYVPPGLKNPSSRNYGGVFKDGILISRFIESKVVRPVKGFTVFSDQTIIGGSSFTPPPVQSTTPSGPPPKSTIAITPTTPSSPTPTHLIEVPIELASTGISSKVKDISRDMVDGITKHLNDIHFAENAVLRPDVPRFQINKKFKDRLQFVPMPVSKTDANSNPVTESTSTPKSNAVDEGKGGETGKGQKKKSVSFVSTGPTIIIVKQDKIDRYTTPIRPRRARIEYTPKFDSSPLSMPFPGVCGDGNGDGDRTGHASGVLAVSGDEPKPDDGVAARIGDTDAMAQANIEAVTAPFSDTKSESESEPGPNSKFVDADLESQTDTEPGSDSDFDGLFI